MNVVIKKLWPELAIFKYRLISVIVLGVIVSGLKSAIPELTNQLVASWSANDKNLAYQIPVVICLLWIVSSIARYFHLYWMKYISDLVAVKLRRDLMNKYLSLNIGFVQNFNRGSGGLISRMINDINIIQTGIHNMADLLREPFMTVFMLGYLIYVDWKLTLFLVAVTPLVTGVLRKIAKSLRKYGHRNQEAMEDLTKTLKESLDGTRVVQSFILEDSMRDKFNTQADYYLETRRKIISREEAAGPITESLTSIVIGLLLMYISYQVFNKEFTTGTFTSFMFAMGFLLDSSKKIQHGYIKLQQASVALERLQEVLIEESTIPEPVKPKQFPSEWSHIHFKQIEFSYGDRPILRNINIDIQRGQKIAIVGESGSGKTTLMNLLERFFDPTSGEILIGSTNIKDMSLKELRSNIALVTQDVFLFSDSIEKNIQLGKPFDTSAPVDRAASLANASSFIEKLPEKIQTKLGDSGSRISGGEKQRISIARAIYKDAPILILDEATSALDSASELEVQKGLNQLMEGRTSFIIAHRLSTITHCDKILVFKEGQLVEEGTHSELLDLKGEYQRYHSMQNFQ